MLGFLALGAAAVAATGTAPAGGGGATPNLAAIMHHYRMMRAA